MLAEIGPGLRMTIKTKICLWFYYRFNGVAQWFINHCDVVIDEE